MSTARSQRKKSDWVPRWLPLGCQFVKARVLAGSRVVVLGQRDGRGHLFVRLVSRARLEQIKLGANADVLDFEPIGGSGEIAVLVATRAGAARDHHRVVILNARLNRVRLTLHDKAHAIWPVELLGVAGRGQRLIVACGRQNVQGYPPERVVYGAFGWNLRTRKLAPVAKLVGLFF